VLGGITLVLSALVAQGAQALPLDAAPAKASVSAKPATKSQPVAKPPQKTATKIPFKPAEKLPQPLGKSAVQPIRHAQSADHGAAALPKPLAKPQGAGAPSVKAAVSQLSKQMAKQVAKQPPKQTVMQNALAVTKSLPKPSTPLKPQPKPALKQQTKPAQAVKAKTSVAAKGAPVVPMALGELPPLDPRVAVDMAVPPGLVQANESRVAAILGPARLVVWEGEARKLQFVGLRCVLDLFLYPAATGQDPRVTYSEARRASDGRRVDRNLCFASLIRH